MEVDTEGGLGNLLPTTPLCLVLAEVELATCNTRGWQYSRVRSSLSHDGLPDKIHDFVRYAVSEEDGYTQRKFLPSSESIPDPFPRFKSQNYKPLKSVNDDEQERRHY